MPLLADKSRLKFWKRGSYKSKGGHDIKTSGAGAFQSHDPPPPAKGISARKKAAFLDFLLVFAFIGLKIDFILRIMFVVSVTSAY